MEAGSNGYLDLFLENEIFNVFVELVHLTRSKNWNKSGTRVVRVRHVQR